MQCQKLKTYMETGRVVFLPAKAIRPNPAQPRKLFREEALEELAEYIHMSKYHFLRKFKELTGVTVHAFVTNKRLIEACELLKAGENITQVYQTCGFTDYSSFLRNFKSTFGVSPGKYEDFYMG